MAKKSKIQKEIIKIIEDKYSNWEEKAQLIQVLFKQEDLTQEEFLEIIQKHPKASIRKSAASIIGYFDQIKYTDILIKRLFFEPDWSVRYALAKSCAKHLQAEAVNHLRLQYNEFIKEYECNKKMQFQLLFVEAIGTIGYESGLPILEAILDEKGPNRDPLSIKIIIQSIYSIGEIGNKSIIGKLLRFSAENPTNTDAMRNSAEHAIDKIAKRLGFASKKGLLEELNKE
ncbi:MAG: hypothetical protein JXA54_00690 [Candidatus Heimdallarchaeota archaeon]|nr:hypothetical protein [Candidatus Heimdallarchaeota archaeon]